VKSNEIIKKSKILFFMEKYIDFLFYYAMMNHMKHSSKLIAHKASCIKG
ncbi:MAG: hypothetical protein K0R34_908, partial [Herbinix sp.]|nr:hypothetical protein [Herbinix sp.]